MPAQAYYGPAPVPLAPTGQPLAGFGARLGAYLIDAIVFVMLSMLIMVPAIIAMVAWIGSQASQLETDPVTGQLTTIVDENPQATFSSFKLRLDGGARGTLTSPPTCGPNTTTSVMTPWSGHADENTPSSSFTLTSDPAGGGCPQTLGARPFNPGYSAKSDSSAAGAYSPFHVNIGRVDGEQELKAVDVTLPKGLVGKLAGIPYCTEAEIAAAAASSGTAEKTSYSCSAASQIGETVTAAGSGSGPIKIAGKAFLAGPYKGAPLSMVVITPAVAGPYDIGTVVVRVALNVNPETAQINAVSDPIPNVFGGVKLDIRAIDVNVNH